jgi:hypothetical protein
MGISRLTTVEANNEPNSFPSDISFSAIAIRRYSKDGNHPGFEVPGDVVGAGKKTSLP